MKKLSIVLLLVAILMISTTFIAIPLTKCEEEDPIHIYYDKNGNGIYEEGEKISNPPGPIVWTGPCTAKSFTITVRIKWDNPPETRFNVQWVDVNMTEKTSFGITFVPLSTRLYNPNHGLSPDYCDVVLTVPVDGKPAGTYAVNIYVDVTAQGPSKNPAISGTDGYFQFVKETCAPPRADLSITKTGPRYAHIGDEITYTFTVTNNGPDEAENVVVTDSVLGVTYELGNLVSGALKTFTVKHTVTGSDPDPLENTATVTSGTSDPDLTNNEASWTVDILHPDIDVSKSGPEYAHEGDTIDYMITVKNTGDCPLSNVVVIDDVLGSIYSGVLDVGEEKTFTVLYTVPSPSGDITNTVTASGEDALGLTVTDSASWTVDILHPAIAIKKSADKDKAYAGDTITYTYTVTNPGDTPLKDVTVVDDVAGAATYVSGDDGNGLLDMGETWIFTATYTVKAGDPDPLVNNATASGKDITDYKVTATDTATVDLIAKICGYKFHDANANGVWDEGEQGLSGWTIELWKGGEKITETTTGSDGSYCFDKLDTGEYVVKEVAQQYWRCTTGSSITVKLESGEISGDNNFGNAKIVTRTQGFWATHYAYTWSVWTTETVGSKTIDSDRKLFGAFWSNIAYKSDGKKRTLLDQARMQLLQQLVAAMLNVKAFGDDDLGTGARLIAAGKDAFAGNDRAAILSIAKQLEEFNKSGEAQPLPPGVIPGPADPETAQNVADKAFWDTLP